MSDESSLAEIDKNPNETLVKTVLVSDGQASELSTKRTSTVEKLSFLEGKFREAGFALSEYTGEILPKSFNEDSQAGTRHNLYVEPGGQTCYKTIRRDTVDAMSKTDLQSGQFPYLVNEALFLSRIDHPNIPKFEGCFRLPDGRPAVGEEYIGNSVPIPGVEAGLLALLDRLPKEQLPILIKQLAGVAEAVDRIIQLGGSINKEIFGNLRIQFTDEQQTQIGKIWLVDFDECMPPGSLPANKTDCFNEDFAQEVVRIVRNTGVIPMDKSTDYAETGFVKPPNNTEYIKRMVARLPGE